MNDDEINQAFQNIVQEFEDIHLLIKEKPLLAHYTSISTIESVMKNEEIWFSNPLFMNDLQELRFGINEGMAMIMQMEELTVACGSIKRAEEVKRLLKYYYDEFDAKHALNVYVFCLTEHKPSNDDGVLSMWRAYGAQGNGAALVFNTGFITFNASSPLVMSKVHYKNSVDRVNWLRDQIGKYLQKLRDLSLNDDKLFIAAFQLFNLIKVFALTFKHDGFSEEREWRVIYMPDRDVGRVLTDKFSYHIGPRGVEPKLKFPIAPLNIPDAGVWSFESILEKIILGPSVSSPLAKASIIRMLEALGKANFVKKVVASTIPLRAV